jgi:hypothetical protein
MLGGLYGGTSAVNKMIFDFWCFKATFSNISAISWRPVLVEEAGGPGGSHRSWASIW